MGFRRTYISVDYLAETHPLPNLPLEGEGVTPATSTIKKQLHQLYSQGRCFAAAYAQGRHAALFVVRF